MITSFPFLRAFYTYSFSISGTHTQREKEYQRKIDAKTPEIVFTSDESKNMFTANFLISKEGKKEKMIKEFALSIYTDQILYRIVSRAYFFGAKGEKKCVCDSR